MIVDYWVLRKTHLHVPMLYQNEGIYKYTWGINWRAFVTLVVVIPVNLPGLIHAINPKVSIGNFSYFCTFAGYLLIGQGWFDYADKASWLTSFFIATGVYLILSSIFPPTSTFVEATVESMDEDISDPMTDSKGWEKENGRESDRNYPIINSV